MLELDFDYDLLDYEEDDLGVEDIPNESLLDEKTSVSSPTKNEDQENKQKGFRDFLLKPELLRAINDCGFENPSEVQNECIPQAILGMDILCQAKSGMGKTCVFVISTLQQLDKIDDKVSILVISHTRELAFQISKEYERFSKYMKVNVAVFFGGFSLRVDEQVLRINRPQVVVSTTGRMIDLIRCKKINLNHVKHFVIDECDKILGLMDSRMDVMKINENLPRDKQVMMFSATLSDDMRTFCKLFLESPLEVIIGDDTKLTLHGLQQYYVDLQEKEKNRKLYDILTTVEFNQAIIFVKTIQRCIALHEILDALNLSVTNIHSSMTQEMRLYNYQIVKKYKKRILVTTKMFDRGIDFDRVNLVINYDMPDDSDTYLHAVGRAGRFGTKGTAITFVAGHVDSIVFKEVKSRFDIEFSELPEEIDI